MTEQALKELLASMTIEEKANELWQPQNRVFDENGVLTGNEVSSLATQQEIDGCGSTLNLFGIDKLNKLQKNHIERNPHHIPMMFMADIIRGYATILPQPLASSCSFDPELIRRACEVSAKESSVSGLHITFYPMIDIVRDPRWGRVVESAGEDPFLAHEICKAIVEGLQGNDLSKEGTIGACVKHFAGYGGAEGGRDYNSVELTERTMRQYHLCGYQGGIEAGAAMVMTSYNTVGGVPSTANRWLFRDILKGEWNFDGVVITDLWALSSMNVHGVGESSADRARMALDAGIDIEMGSDAYVHTLPQLIRDGVVDEKLLDDAVWRVLKLKNRLGLFENPYRFADKKKAEKILLCDEHRAVARKLSTESCVLLENAGSVLPLGEQSGKVAFIGPFVKMERMNGAWVVVNDETEHGDTLENRIKTQIPNGNFVFADGCPALGREQKRESERFGFADEEHREQMIAEAVEFAKTADTVVLTLGELGSMSGESRSRANIRVPDVQLELLNRIYEVNKNIAVLLYNGRPLDLTEVKAKAKAILDVWYLGTEMNAAVTDLLFGKSVPSGKLTMSFPSSVNQIPVYYNHLNTDHRTAPYWSEYIDDYSSVPLYPFGYGLSYTEFAYGPVTLSSDTMTADGRITASVTLTNKGSREATETVQMYLQDPHATVSRPIKELKGFRRVAVKADQSVTVSFDITEPMLRYWNIDMKYVSDPGTFFVFIGGNSDVSEKAEFTLC